MVTPGMPLFDSLGQHREATNIPRRRRSIYGGADIAINLSQCVCVCVCVFAGMLERQKENPCSEWLETWHSTLFSSLYRSLFWVL